MKNRTNFIGYPIVAIIAALITYYCTREPGPVITPDPTQPEEIISFKDAVQLYGSYSKNRACVIKTFESRRDSLLDKLCPSDRKPISNFVPSRSFYLSKDFLDEYISYVKWVTPDSIDITGYRLYLGNYPDAEKFVDGKPIPDPRRNTFFIAPTTLLGSDNLHRGYTFADRNNDGRQELVFLEDVLDQIGYGEQGSLDPQMMQQIQTAGFFSAFMGIQENQSTIANDIGSYP
ncbi:hypothetical protein [Aquimarina spongiae]|uniref:Uncharacterized protein n=1 Tax=Aquimarina spongiae TaxID=570521 RepID=A0A1M6EDE2_9FLAO|nr:hypothetical protein [Aquimarina spongiae]SHI83451.1 hypothetical protein SAMN04488508_103354 [Aquimarina spongiae]